jgi:hypothetical protein
MIMWKNFIIIIIIIIKNMTKAFISVISVYYCNNLKYKNDKNEPFKMHILKNYFVE